MTNNERLESLRERARTLGYDLAWACANQAWAVMDYRPHAPETSKLRAVKNNLDELEEWIKSKEGY